jgi:hypothetical protein
MLQRSDGCCRGDETLGRGRDAPRQRGGGWGRSKGWCRGEARSAARWVEERGVAGKERGGLDAGAQPGWD